LNCIDGYWAIVLVRLDFSVLSNPHAEPSIEGGVKDSAIKIISN